MAYGLHVTVKNIVNVVDLSGDLRQKLQELIGTDDLEMVKPRELQPPYIMVIHGSGLLHDLPQNSFGSYLYQTFLHGQPVVGDIVILSITDNGRGYWEGISLTEVEGLKIQYAHVLTQISQRLEKEKAPLDNGGNR